MSFVTAIDDIISVFSPSTAIRRAEARNAYNSIKHRRYEGAQINKNDQYWLTNTHDADGDILRDLPKLRERSRELIQNNPWAISVVSHLIANVVGENGHVPRCPKDNNYETWLKEKLEEIGEDGLDITEEQDFSELEALALWQLIESGEAFSHFVYDCNKRLKIQNYEADQVYSFRNAIDGNEIRAGIEIQKSTGKHLSYFINEHPGSYSSYYKRTEEERVFRKDMLHLFFRTRPGQTRGVPRLAPAIISLRDMKEYKDVTMVAARVAACLALIIQKDQHYTPRKDDNDDPVRDIYPGMIARLKPGENAFTINPNQPGGQFTNVMNFNSRSVAAASGSSYESVSRDYSQVNYSSGRLSKLDERKTYRIIQNFMAKHYCKRISYEIQRLRLLLGEQKKFVVVKWLPPGFEWVDPIKEIEADILEVENNFTTKAAKVAERGGDYEDIIVQRAIEIQREKELGILPGKKEKTNDGTAKTTDENTDTNTTTDGKK